MEDIKINVGKKKFLFCSKSEVLSAHEIFCLIEPKFKEESANCIFSSRKANVFISKEIRKKINPMLRIKKMRIFSDILERKKLIIELKA